LKDWLARKEENKKKRNQVYDYYKEDMTHDEANYMKEAIQEIKKAQR
jgi:hypothetical protein